MPPQVQEGLHKCKCFWHEHVNFLELHYLYIGAMCFIVAGLFYCQPGTDWNFANCLFMSTTAVTNTGLNTVDMSELSLYQYLLILFTSIICAPITISVFVVFVRKYYFSKRFEDVLLYNRAQRLKEESHRRLRRQQQQQQQRRSNIILVLSKDSHHPGFLGIHRDRMPSFYSVRSATASRIKHWLVPHRNESDRTLDARIQAISDRIEALHSSDVGETRTEASVTRPRSMQRAATIHETNTIAFADDIDQQRQQAQQRLEQEHKFDELLGRIAQDRDRDELEDAEEEEESEIKSIMQQPIHPHQLTRRQQYRIGGAEYRALDFLLRAIPIIYFTILLAFAFGLRIYIAVSTYAQEVVHTSNPNEPVDPWLFSFFVTVSALNSMSLSPIAASMVPFANAPAPLLIVATLIILGHTGWAAILRFVIWCFYKLTPETYAMHRETLRYLLDHPRRCYYSMFPSNQTWWLVFAVVIIDLVEAVVFLTTNFFLPVLEGINWGSIVLISFFQGVATRNGKFYLLRFTDDCNIYIDILVAAGLAAVNLMDVNPGTQLVYIVAMYISVYPVAISIRNSNIYQERELGIYSSPDENDNGGKATSNDDDIWSAVRLRRMPTMSSVVTTLKKLLPKRPSFYVMTQLAREIVWVIVGILSCASSKPRLSWHQHLSLSYRSFTNASRHLEQLDRPWDTPASPCRSLQSITSSANW